jgi:hypothetical protein
MLRSFTGGMYSTLATLPSDFGTHTAMVDEDAQPGADFKSLSGGFGADFAEESEVFSGEVSGNQTDLLWESSILSDEEMRPNQKIGGGMWYGHLC